MRSENTRAVAVAPGQTEGREDGRLTGSSPIGVRSQASAEELPNHPDVWIVVPSYNEAPRLGDTLRDLLRAYANVVVVDDGSTDGTATIARTYPIWLIRHTVNCGQGAALQTGFEFALERGADIVVSFDADGQHRCEDVAGLIEPVARGSVDICLGSRFLGSARNIPLGRWLLLKAAVLFTRASLGLRVSDTHNGLRALSRSAALSLRIDQGRMAHASEILASIRDRDWRYREVPVTVLYSEGTLRKGQTLWNAFGIVGQLLAGRLMK